VWDDLPLEKAEYQFSNTELDHAPIVMAASFVEATRRGE
jgi:hypothetical protein